MKIGDVVCGASSGEYRSLALTTSCRVEAVAFIALKIAGNPELRRTECCNAAVGNGARAVKKSTM
jgi:hypothetical protein